MRSAGLDIGSRSIELVVMENGSIVDMLDADTGGDPQQTADGLLRRVTFDRIIATGYGRSMMEVARDFSTVTEIKAYAAGARYLHPNVRTIVDIGGQDSKVIGLDEQGRVYRFEMNDRCAAGSGRFLENMASVLGYSISEFGDEALQAESAVRVNTMCAVFAESEVTSLLHKGAARRDVALGLHGSIVQRLLAMLNRVSMTSPVMLAGGVARNPCVKKLLEDALHVPVLVVEHPHRVGAIGAACLAEKA